MLVLASTQTGIPGSGPRGHILYVLGAFTMYDGVSMSYDARRRVIGAALSSCMPAMVRTRFSTPTIGREWMIGEMGRAITSIDPDGVVQIKEAQWRAFTNRATPIELDGCG
jgi:membrane-bound serine protease (ClpP class)